MDSFIESGTELEPLEETGECENDALIFRHLEPLYDPLVDEIQEECDSEWTKKFRKLQSMKLCKIDELVILMCQYQTEFYFLPFQTILEEFFYQVCLTSELSQSKRKTFLENTLRFWKFQLHQILRE